MLAVVIVAACGEALLVSTVAGGLSIQIEPSEAVVRRADAVTIRLDGPAQRTRSAQPGDEVAFTTCPSARTTSSSEGS